MILNPLNVHPNLGFVQACVAVAVEYTNCSKTELAAPLYWRWLSYEKVLHHGETMKLKKEKMLVVIGEYKYPRAVLNLNLLQFYFLRLAKKLDSIS
jgi:hypothetical protein